MAEEDEDAPELQVTRLFQLAGHEVTQAVGDEPGKVDWFATPREGFVRPRTYWQAWRTCPEDLEAALEVLEQARVAKHADRALGVVIEGELPDGYTIDLEKKPTGAISPRLLILSLFGVPELVHQIVQKYEREQKHTRFMRRHGRVGDRNIPDAVAYIESWVDSPTSTNLVVRGAPCGDSSAVVDEAIYRAGKRFLKAPGKTRPILDESSLDTLSSRSSEEAKAALYPHIVEGFSRFDIDAEKAFLAFGLVHLDLRTSVVLNLAPPSVADVDAWYREHAGERKLLDAFCGVCHSVPSFKELADKTPNHAPMLEVLARVDMPALDVGVAEWTARFVSSYMSILLEKVRDAPSVHGHLLEDTVITFFEQAAIEQFGMSAVSSLDTIPRTRDDWEPIAASVSTWTSPAPLALLPDRLQERARKHAYDRAPARISNDLVLHYFLARKIAREVRAGNLDILTRYQFPREHVLLFLAILAPDVAARATADRGEAIRAQIETEVERRLQLTLAHALKRSAGAVRSHLRSIQRHVQRTTPGALAHEFARIEEEAAFQSALAEQTRLWHEVPESEVVGLSLWASLAPVVTDLREAYPRVAFESTVDPSLRVRATQEVLREIVHCLLENAFQAVSFADGPDRPRVGVEARVEGGTVRLDVLDNGPGVAAGDRERIFELYVSTKKGDDRPLGTGMGLPIARRYAEHVGGQVGLDPEREETCFFVRLVAWRDIG